MLLGCGRRGRGRATGEPAFLAELRHGWREFSSPQLAGGSIVHRGGGRNAVFFPAFQVLGPTVAQESLDGSSSWALIAAAMGRRRPARRRLLALAIRPRRPLLVGEGLIMLIAAAGRAAGAAGVDRRRSRSAALIAGAAGSLAEILFETAWVQHVPAESRSRVVAYDWFGSLALEPLGLALVGPLAAGDRHLDDPLAGRGGDRRLPSAPLLGPQRAPARSAGGGANPSPAAAAGGARGLSPR